MLDDRAAECDATHYFTPCPGYNVAQCLSEHTGGRISVAHNSKQIEHSFQQIQNELRLQYAVSYSPSDIEAGGRFHRVEVRCNGESGQALKVNVRKGYYAPKSGR
jgi:VWFA-related protein